MKYIYLPTMLFSVFTNYCNASFSELPQELKNEVLNNLSKTDANKAAPVSKEMNKLVKSNTQCPVLNQTNISQNPNLANATTNQMHDLVGKNVTILGRTYQISYLHIGFSGTFIDFMKQNNINVLNPLGAQSANELLGHHYQPNPNTECVYDLHNPAMEGATLVLKG
jgi:F-box domain